MPTVKQSNNRVLIAWGESFLDFNMRWLVKLANEKQVDLWPELLKVDEVENVGEKISVMNNLFERLLK